MSKHQQDRARLESLVLSCSRRASKVPSNQSKKGTTASSSMLSSEEASFTYSFWLGVTLLLRDQPCSPGVVGGFKTLLHNVLESRDLLGFIDSCSAIRLELVQAGSWSAAFKRGSRWAKSVGGLIESIFQPISIRHPSPIFDQVVTYLGWLKRLPVCIRPTSDGVDAYYECDRRISNVKFDTDTVERLRGIWHEWFGSFRITSDWMPRHGSGSTADCGRDRARKWRDLTVDRSASVCFRDARLEPILALKIGTPTRCSKVVFVPKQAGKDRTICMEPAWLQYLQQGVAGQLVDYCSAGSHPLSRLVNITDQEVNRCLCADAWLHRYATIDLSDASDSVSWRLIKRLTHGLPLQRYLYGCRSNTTLIDGREIAFDKFAPMGSALCFPIECYLFASVVELAHRIYYGKAGAGHTTGCSVYGDDIICPSEMYDLVVDILQSLGFLVNTTKSYSSGAYYESCGVEYLYGVRIRTIRHPRTHLLPKKVVSPDVVDTVVDLANELLRSRYFHTRRLLLKSYEEAVVRVGGKTYRFMDLVLFDNEHCVPLIDEYGPRVWKKDLQVSGQFHQVVETSVGSTSYDFQQWKSSGKDRTRAERIRDLYPVPKRVKIDPKWSHAGVLALSKFGFFELLEGEDVATVRSSRTGRPAYRVRKRFFPR